MTGVVVAYLAGVLFGLVIVLLAAETPHLLRKVFRHWQSHNQQVNADIRFMRSIPKGMEDEQ